MIHALSDGGEHTLFKDEYFKVDGYDSSTNTVYEFHGCLECYSDREVGHPRGKTVQKIYDDTIAREKELLIADIR